MAHMNRQTTDGARSCQLSRELQLVICRAKRRKCARFTCANKPNASPTAGMARQTHSWLCWGAGNGRTRALGKPPRGRRVLPRSCDTEYSYPEHLPLQTWHWWGGGGERRTKPPSSGSCGRETPLRRRFGSTYSLWLAAGFSTGFWDTVFLLFFFCTIWRPYRCVTAIFWS